MKHYLLLFVSLAGMVACKPAATEKPFDPNNLELILNEDFNDTTLHRDIWGFDLGNGCPELCGWGNAELQTYTDSNFHIDNGFLTIIAKKDDSIYTSTRLTTKNKFDFTYGKIEMRAKLPMATGTWPAFWMLGTSIDEKGWPACGEIDIMEFAGKDSTLIHTTLHTADSYGNSKNTRTTEVANLNNVFHTYSAIWTETYIEFYIDNNKVYSFLPVDLENENIWPFNHPFYILVNLAVGGTFGGEEVDETAFPQEYVIDYIKVWQEKTNS